ncbi:MAG: hypothetical protein RMJ98_18940, partial [Myxococcales bacterium]|nr:hypothetical protein [Polyangiaceae bacterium]MDW8251378.1 hypothetical protein [Myxococcales bacterium]
AARGYSEADHEEGWSLLHKVSGHRPVAAPSTPPDNAIRSAINTLDAWDEDGYRLVRAALARRFPEQLRFVLEGLAPVRGTGAVLSVKNLLDRLDALETSPDRASSREQDLAAIAAIAAKGLSREERARLRALVSTAQGLMAPGAPASEPVCPPVLQDLQDLKAWYVEWAETARVAIKRRDYLIRLGLAKRKARKKGEDTDET